MFRTIFIACALSSVQYKAVFAAPVTIMPVGDSITSGWNGGPADLKGSYRYELGILLDQSGIEYDFVGEFQRGPGDNDHQGLSGASIATMVNNYGPSIAARRPDYALVMAGTNNHFHGPDDAYFVGQYTDLINTIRGNSPDTSIIIATVPKFGYNRVPDTSYWTDAFVDFRNEETFPSMNRAIRDVANAFDDVEMVDFYLDLDPSIDLVADAVHPNLYGHQKLANLYFGELSRQISAVPEPASCFFLGIACSAGLLRRKQRARRL